MTKVWFTKTRHIYNLQVEFSPEEETAIQNVLKQRLGPQFISQRTGAAGLKVSKWDLLSMFYRLYTGVFKIIFRNMTEPPFQIWAAPLKDANFSNPSFSYC